jgi:Tfp pilus assembly protein PilF
MVFGARRLKLAVLFCLVSVFLFGQTGLALDKRYSRALSHYIMAVMYDDSGNTGRAIQEYKQALQLDNKNTAIHLNLAVAYIKNNEINKAYPELELIGKLDPQAVDAHAILSFLYSLQKKSGEASREYEIALKNASRLNPQNIEIYKSLGALYVSQEKFQAAENIYRLILNLSPADTEAHFYLANVYEESGDLARAEEELKKTLALKPDYPEALNYLGYLYLEENKNLDAAETMIKKALQMQPDNGAYLDSLGWFYFKKGRTEEALKLLLRASALIEDPVVYDHLGDVYSKIGDTDNAKINWAKSLKLDPKQDKIKQKLETLRKACQTPIPKSGN